MKNNLYRIDLESTRFLVRTHNSSFGEFSSILVANEKEHLRYVHTHLDYEIFIVLDGQLSVFSEKDTIVCHDSIVIVPPGIRHYSVFEEALGGTLYFTPQLYDESLKEQYNTIIDSISNDILVYPISKSERFCCEQLIEFKSRVTFKEVDETLLTLLFAEIFSRFIPEERISPPLAKNQYITVIETYIAANSTRRIFLEDLANELHLCTKQVARIIKKEYGYTLSELVARHRISIAQMLLKKTNMKTYEISAFVGYESPKDFRINFKKYCSLSPTEYRKQQADKGKK